MPLRPTVGASEDSGIKGCGKRTSQTSKEGHAFWQTDSILWLSSSDDCTVYANVKWLMRRSQVYSETVMCLLLEVFISAASQGSRVSGTVECVSTPQIIENSSARLRWSVQKNKNLFSFLEECQTLFKFFLYSLLPLKYVATLCNTNNK